MPATLTQLTTRTRATIGNPDTTTVPDATLYQCINDALREIEAKYRLQQREVIYNFPTVASTSTYAIPTDCEGVLQLWNVTRGVRLYKASQEQWYETVPTVTAAPIRYFRNGRNVILDPVPDAVYSMNLIYKQTHADLTSGGDQMILRDSWLSGVVMLSRYHYYVSVGNDPAKAREAYSAFAMFVNDLPSEAEEESQDTILGSSVGVFERNLSGTGTLDFDHES